MDDKNARGTDMPRLRKVSNPRQLKSYRQTLRNQLTRPEAHLWYCLRRNQLGMRFRRQHGIGGYIVDFYCPGAGLVVEIDGDSHYVDSAKVKDRVRDDYLASLGLNVLRFTNRDVMENREAVVAEIHRWVAASG